MGLAFPILGFTHFRMPRLKVKPEFSPPWQTELQAQVRRQRSPARPSGHQDTRSGDLWGQPWHPGYTGTSPKTHHDLHLQAPRDGSPSQPGRDRKTPGIFRKEGPLLSARQRGQRAREGPGGAAHLPWLQPSRNWSVLSRQSEPPAQPGRFMERKSLMLRGSGLWISPSQRGRGEEGPQNAEVQGGQSRGGAGQSALPPDICSPSTDSIKEGQPDTVTTGKVTCGSVPAAREGSDLFPRPIQEPPCKPRRLTQPDDKGKGGWGGGGGVWWSNMALPPIPGAPTAAPPPLLTLGVARVGLISSTTCHLALVLLAFWNILPIFSLGRTRGGPGLPRMLAQEPVHTPLPKNYTISRSFEEHSSLWALFTDTCSQSTISQVAL